MNELMIAAVTAAASFLGSWGALKVSLRYIRRDVDAAHDRLNQINAPAARVRLHSAD